MKLLRAVNHSVMDNFSGCLMWAFFLYATKSYPGSLNWQSSKVWELLPLMKRMHYMRSWRNSKERMTNLTKWLSIHIWIQRMSSLISNLSSVENLLKTQTQPLGCTHTHNLWCAPLHMGDQSSIPDVPPAWKALPPVGVLRQDPLMLPAYLRNEFKSLWIKAPAKCTEHKHKPTLTHAHKKVFGYIKYPSIFLYVLDLEWSCK